MSITQCISKLETVRIMKTLYYLYIYHMLQPVNTLCDLNMGISWLLKNYFTLLKFTDHLSGNFSSFSYFYSIYKLSSDLKNSFTSALQNHSQHYRTTVSIRIGECTVSILKLCRLFHLITCFQSICLLVVSYEMTED